MKLDWNTASVTQDHAGRHTLAVKFVGGADLTESEREALDDMRGDVRQSEDFQAITVERDGLAVMLVADPGDVLAQRGFPWLNHLVEEATDLADSKTQVRQRGDERAAQLEKQFRQLGGGSG